MTPSPTCMSSADDSVETQSIQPAAKKKIVTDHTIPRCELCKQRKVCSPSMFNLSSSVERNAFTARRPTCPRSNCEPLSPL